MLKDFLTPQFVNFILTGGFAALVNFVVGFLLADYLPWNLDYVVGHLSGMVVAFILFELLVFGKSDDGRHRSVGMFVIVNLLAVLQTYIIGTALENYLFPSINYQFFANEVARAIAIMVPVLTSFIGHKYFTFRQHD